MITSKNEISAGATQSCIFKQVKELTIWMVNLSSLFFSHEYVSYAFIASPMSHLCEPLLWIKLNDFVIPFFFFADDPEYQKVFATFDELNLGHLRPVFKGKHLRVRSQIWEYLAIRSWFIFTGQFLDLRWVVGRIIGADKTRRDKMITACWLFWFDYGAVSFLPQLTSFEFMFSFFLLF